jgi:hypothetical protein
VYGLDRSQNHANVMVSARLLVSVCYYASSRWPFRIRSTCVMDVTQYVVNSVDIP